MKPPGAQQPELGPEAGDARLVLDAMVELAASTRSCYGPDGQAIDYRILDCNTAFTRITGIRREQAVGRLASEVYGGSPPYLEVYARVADTGEPDAVRHLLPADESALQHLGGLPPKRLRSPPSPATSPSATSAGSACAATSSWPTGVSTSSSSSGGRTGEFWTRTRPPWPPTATRGVSFVAAPSSTCASVPSAA